MGNSPTTPPGAGFVGKSRPAPTGLGLAFVLGDGAGSYPEPYAFLLGFLSGQKSSKEGSWVFPCRCPQRRTGALMGLLETACRKGSYRGPRPIIRTLSP